MHDEIITVAYASYSLIKASHSPNPAPTGTMWSNHKDLTAIIETSQTAEEAVRRVQNTYRYSINPPEQRITEKMVDWYLLFLGDSPNIREDSAFSGNAVIRNGKRLTPDYLRTVAIVNTIERHCSIAGYSRIMELGGGCGHLARNGVAWFVELKSETGKLTPAQRLWQEALEGDGVATAHYLIWRPSMRKEIEEILK